MDGGPRGVPVQGPLDALRGDEAEGPGGAHDRGGTGLYLIDGYNLLHAAARGKATAAARDALLAAIEAWCRAGNYPARIVFDATGGLKRRDRRGLLEVRNVPEGRTADEEILAALAASADRTEYTLVSNDLELVRAAEKKGVQVLSCEDFAARVLSPPPDGPEKPGAPSEAEVDRWMKEFGLEE
jgi:predicted RNA-binding protein with PIN domain